MEMGGAARQEKDAAAPAWHEERRGRPYTYGCMGEKRLLERDVARLRRMKRPVMGSRPFFFLLPTNSIAMKRRY